MPAPDYASEIAALEAKLAEGELKIESDGEQLWNKSADDILTQLAYFRSQAAAAAATGRPAATVAIYDPR